MANIKLKLSDYRDKVLGCWMGKNIGGTLGAPFEWRRQINDVNFYTADLHGDPLPNDDLDIQLLWVVALEELGVEVDAKRLAEYWLLYLTPHWAEYGNAKINLKSGLIPPLSGSMNNSYKDSCGAYIRSEIWACIAPGIPGLAARFAFEDAIIDHGDGEGVYGEVFCAAFESAAFVEKDLRKLIDIGLSYIPAGCGVAGAVNCALECYRTGKTWLEARDLMLADYRGLPFPGCISAKDVDKGFGTGQKGWDVPSNIGMLVIGLLYGEGDFDRSMCITVNCGEDTDCTGATCGSIFGIMNGYSAIPDKWIQPIGRKLKTACLNLGELGFFGWQLPQDVDELSTRVENITRQVILKYALSLELSDDRQNDKTGDGSGEPGDVLQLADLAAGEDFLGIYDYMRGPVYKFDFFNVFVDYGGGDARISDNETRKIKLRVENKYKIQEMLNVRIMAPSGWSVTPMSGKVFILPQMLGPTSSEVELEIRADRVDNLINRLHAEFTFEGRHTVMTVPIVFISGNMMK